MLFIYFYIWVCVALCLLEFACVPRMVHMSGKEGQWLKVGSGATPALHLMNIWLKHCLSSPSQRLLCFKASRYNVVVGGGVQNSQCCLLTAAFFYILSFFFFPSSHPFPLPCISLSLFFLCSLFVNVSILQENTFYVLSDGRLCFFSLSLRENKWFAAFHCHYCCH